MIIAGFGISLALRDKDLTVKDKMDALYEAFLDNLLTLVETGRIKASDRAVIRLFLKDHGMAQKNPNRAKVKRLEESQMPVFEDDDDDH
jgi:hypothetical protein